jgi:hypothetical protein
MFRFSIMFFSFFDLISCIAIFWLLYRTRSQTPTPSAAEAPAHTTGAPATVN